MLPPNAAPWDERRHDGAAICRHWVHEIWDLQVINGTLREYDCCTCITRTSPASTPSFFLIYSGMPWLADW